mmetsp:Transcript_14942/g.62169  ORF Transcript_14942/g.62169 Transcript_14942/m.62169 type:complete len:1146 (-) Transcript_14942:47-3484(-)
MVKMRMTAADVAAQVACLQRLVGFRLANVYDLDSTTYVFKLSKSGGASESGEAEKALLLCESGVRLHTTAYAREKADTPSNITLKLRKHIRTRRLESVRQVGADRIVQLTFSRGEGEHHVFIELYAQGNLVLCDREMNVLTLLRSHRDDARGLAIMPNHPYPLEHFRPRSKATATALREALEACNFKDTLKQALLAHYAGGLGPQLAEHAVVRAGMDPGANAKQALDSMDAEREERLLSALQEIDAFLDGCAEGSAPKGYITRKRAKVPKGASKEVAEAAQKRVIFDDVVPMLYAQLEHGGVGGGGEGGESGTGSDTSALEFDTFDAAMDEYFSKIEEQKAETQRAQQEAAALSKLTKVQSDQTKRAKALEEEVELQERKAQLIEYNLESVDAAIAACNSALAGGMDWKDLGQLIKTEKKAGNPVAGLIHSLQLERNAITLLLRNTLDEDDERDVRVEVSLDKSAYANARLHFSTRKKRAEKQQKTLDAQGTALAAAERKMEQQLQKVKTVSAIQKARKVHWFEKFHWFVSSENYLVIAGRDAQQNELIVKRYLKGANLYVHADLHGAASCVVVNPSHDGSTPVPPLTLQQAGTFCVCRSKAWDSRVVTSAWWVYGDQVSKTAPSGEYLTTGSFMIRGKKNFLPPAQLVMGFTFVFRLDESSLAAHLGERAPRGAESDAGGAGLSASAHSALLDGPEVTDEEDGSEDDSGLSGCEQQDQEAMQPSDRHGRHAHDEKEAAVDEETSSHSGGASPTGAAADDDDDDGDEDDLFAAMDTMRLTGGRGGDAVTLERAAPPPSAAIASQGAGDEDSKENDGEGSAAGDLMDAAGGGKNCTGRKYMSKRQRKLAAMGISEEEDAASAKERAAALEEARAAERRRKEEKAARAALDANARAKAGTVRGKKSKLKKMKKYAEQDEEDRNLAMAVLGSAGMSKKERQAQAAREAAEAKARKEREKEERKRAYDQKLKELSGSAADAAAASAPAGSRAERKAAARAEAEAEREEIDAILEEENITELTDAQREQVKEIDAFTGAATEDDVLQYAIPMCAPYSALANPKQYKFRVKLTPTGGPSGKKGRLARTAVEVFSRTAGCTDREKELMRAVPDVELTTQMIGGKLSTPGLQQVKQNQKATRKNAAKASRGRA